MDRISLEEILQCLRVVWVFQKQCRHTWILSATEVVWVVERIDRYRACANLCAKVDYANRHSVRHYNRASDQMRAIVGEAYQAGPAAMAELIPLLDEPPADEWLAIQLLDLGLPPVAIIEHCLAIVRRKAAGSGADAMGAGMWLREWQQRHAEPIAAVEPAESL